MKARWLAAALVGGVLVGTLPAAAQQKVTIAVSVPSADHGWTGGLLYAAKKEATLLEKAYPGLRVIVKPSPGAADQASALEDLIAGQQVDALVVLPQNSAELTAPIKRVKDKGVFVTVVDRGLTDPTIQDVYVAGNNPALGRVSGEYFKQRFPDGADIVVLRGIPTVIDNERVDGFKKAIEGTKIKILDSQYANWSRDDGFKVMQDFLAKYKHIDAVWAQDDDIALGVLAAINQAKRDDIKLVLGGAGMKDMIKKVMDGDKLMPVDVLYPYNMIVTAMAVTAARYYGNAAVRGTYTLDTPLITKENAKEFYDPSSPF